MVSLASPVVCLYMLFCDCACPCADGGDADRHQLRLQLTAAQQEASRLTAQRGEAARTADLLRTELRVAMEALSSQRREEELRLMSSSDTRLHVRGVSLQLSAHTGMGERQRWLGLLGQCYCLYPDPFVWIA